MKLGLEHKSSPSKSSPLSVASFCFCVEIHYLSVQAILTGLEIYKHEIALGIVLD